VPAPILCPHQLWRFTIQQQSIAPQSDHALLAQVRSMWLCSWTLPYVSSLAPSIYTSPMASSAVQHWTAGPMKEGCHWQAGGENRQTWQLANPAWYPSPIIATTDIQEAAVAGLATSWHQQLMEAVGSGGQFSPSVRPHNLATGFWPPSATLVSAEPFSHGTGTLRCLQKEMATYRHWSVSLRRDPDDVDVPHCRILSSDKTEWWFISATLCR